MDTVEKLAKMLAENIPKDELEAVIKQQEEGALMEEKLGGLFINHAHDSKASSPLGIVHRPPPTGAGPSNWWHPRPEDEKIFHLLAQQAEPVSKLSKAEQAAMTHMRHKSM